MRNVRNVMVLGVTIATLAGTTAAMAAWQDYTYADQAFLVTFPADPVVETGTYKAPDGSSLSDKTYTVNQNKILLRATVVDFSSTSTKKADVIRAAVSDYLKKGKLIEDTFARIGSDFGRNLNIMAKDGTHYVSSIYFANGRKLYLIDGVTLPGGDAGSNAPTRFRESLSFVADPAAAPAAGAGRGAGGAGGGRGGRGGGRGAAPPADGAAPPAAGAAPAAPAAAPQP